MIKLVHAADFHLDSPFESLPPDKARMRREEQRDDLFKLRDIVNSEDADIVLLAGDLFDSDNAFHDTTKLLEEVFASMNSRIFISPGNHDFYSPRSPYRAVEWPDNVHIFKTTRIECVELPELGARVFGAGFISPSCSSPLLRDFKAGPDMINIMVLHGDTVAATDEYNPVSPEDIAFSGLNYLALGHIHKFSGILKSGDTCYAYPGCPSGRGFDEQGEKGVIVGTVSGSGADLRFVPLGGRRYLTIERDYEALIEGRSSLPEGCENDIVRVILTGERDGHVKIDELEEKYGAKFFHLSFRDRTRERRDIWAAAREDTLKGTYMRLMHEALEKAGSDGQRELITIAARYGLAALENGEVPVL